MMNFHKAKLIVMAVMLFVANQSNASGGYDVSVDTSSLVNTDGYLYFQYIPVNAVNSSATVSGISTDGVLGAQDSLDVVNGGSVTGTLPNNVFFSNANGINDYEQAIHFGNTLDFLLSFSVPVSSGASNGGSSTFSLGIFSDALGSAPLMTSDGTLFTVNLFNNGSTTALSAANQAQINPVPLPSAAWLLGSGLIGLTGIARKQQRQTA